MSVNYYDILEVDSNVTESEIKKAYRKLAKKHHPDLNPNDPRASEKFELVYIAYDVLQDPMKRKIYDQLLVQKEQEAYTTQFSSWQNESKNYATAYASMRYRDFEKVCMTPTEFHLKQSFITAIFTTINILGLALLAAGFSTLFDHTSSNYLLFGFISIITGSLIVYFAGKFLLHTVRIWKIRHQEHQKRKQNGEEGNCI